MRLLFFTILFGLNGHAFASDEEVRFRIEDGYKNALLFLSGDESSAAAKLYKRMEYVRPIDEYIGLSKSWNEQFFH